MTLQVTTVDRGRGLTDADVRELFDRWYAAYPRKVDPGAALRAYKKALKKASPFELDAGLRQYVAYVSGWEKRFIKHPSTWLNGESWLSEIEEPRETVKSARYALERQIFPDRGSTFVRHFLSYIMEPARNLRLTDSDADLARSLGKLYVSIEEARVSSGFQQHDYDELMNNSELLHAYIDWLVDQGWYTATLRVLQFESPAFGSFRRDASIMDQYGRDPITKVSRFSR